MTSISQRPPAGSCYDTRKSLVLQQRNTEAKIKIAAKQAKDELEKQGARKDFIDEEIEALGSPAVKRDDFGHVIRSKPGEHFGELLNYHDDLTSGKYIHAKAFEATAEKLIPRDTVGLARIQTMLEERFGNRIPPYFSRALGTMLTKIDEVAKGAASTAIQKAV